jgi:hypothetical protein
MWFTIQASLAAVKNIWKWNGILIGRNQKMAEWNSDVGIGGMGEKEASDPWSKLSGYRVKIYAEFSAWLNNISVPSQHRKIWGFFLARWEKMIFSKILTWSEILSQLTLGIFLLVYIRRF